MPFAHLHLQVYLYSFRLQLVCATGERLRMESEKHFFLLIVRNLACKQNMVQLKIAPCDTGLATAAGEKRLTLDARRL